MLSALADPKMRAQVTATCSKLMVVIALQCVQFNVAIAQSDQIPSTPNNESNMQNQTSNQWGPPYPFTPDEIQDKLIQVLKVPAYELSKEKVEAIFDMKMVISEKVAPELLNVDPEHPEKNTKWYKVRSEAGVDWYFSLGITVVPNQTYFGFSLWNISKPLPDPPILPMCIDLQKVSEAIEHTNMGWKLVHAPVTFSLHGYVDTSLYYTRNANPWDSIRVGYLRGTNCMTALNFEINTQNGN
jgi:hypothetical protein